LLASVDLAGSSTHIQPKGRPRTLLHDQPIATRIQHIGYVNCSISKITCFYVISIWVVIGCINRCQLYRRHRHPSNCDFDFNPVSVEIYPSEAVDPDIGTLYGHDNSLGVQSMIGPEVGADDIGPGINPEGGPEFNPTVYSTFGSQFSSLDQEVGTFLIGSTLVSKLAANATEHTCVLLPVRYRIMRD
jgi:hypothetical protein